MSNTHGIPDLIKETQSICYDLLPACVINTSGVTAPGSGLTLTSAGCLAYARRGTDLVYIAQPAVSVTVPNVAGSHWLIAHVDTHSAVTDWTRRAGSHWLTRQSATQPATPDGAVLVAQLTVAGGNITVVDQGPAPAPPLSRQTADAVAITGGDATGLATLGAQTGQIGLLGVGRPHDAAFSLVTQGQVQVGSNATVVGSVTTNSLVVNTTSTFTGVTQHSGTLRVGSAAPGSNNYQQSIAYPKNSQYGLIIMPTDNDAGGGNAQLFFNVAGAVVGSINTSATTTTYNTSSDQRLKSDVQPLTGALGVLRALRPVSFVWKADGSPGHGFLAHEVQAIIPEAVSGTPDAVDEAGQLMPMGMDPSKLVVWLVGALHETLAQVEALTARVQALESA